MRSQPSSKARMLSLCLTAALATGACMGTMCRAEEEVYGPVNRLKTMKTPFTSGGGSDTGSNGMSSMTLGHSNSALRRGLAGRLTQSRLYLPGRMVISRPAEFVVKGRPGQFVALAMADKSSGAKPIYGQNLRLGADRKLVAVGEIPENGVVSLVIETPIQGDLIGERWYFEAALWTKPDFSDLEIAQPVPADEGAAAAADKVNGVIVSADIEQKRGVRIVPDAMSPMQRRANAPYALDSGRP